MIKCYLKKRMLFILIVSIICWLLAVVTVHTNDFVKNYYVSEDVLKPGPTNSPFTFITIIACILCTLIPVIEFSFKMQKISIDQMYSLPIKREKLFLSKYIVGLIEILIPITVIFIDAFIIVIYSEHLFDLRYFLPYYLTLIGLIIVLYSTITFFYTRGNTIIDGIMNILFITCFFVAIAGVFGEVIFYQNEYIIENCYFTYSPLSIITSLFNSKLYEKALLEINPKFYGLYDIGIKQIVPLFIMVIVGIVSFILFLVLNKKDKAENSMQISNSWFSYRVMIPAYVSMIIILLSAKITIENYIFIIIGGFIFYVIYRRSIKLQKSDYITFVTCLILSIIIGAIFKEINQSAGVVFEMLNPNSI